MDYIVSFLLNLPGYIETAFKYLAKLPSPTAYFVTLAAFYGTILAIGIPTSIQVLAHISNRYQSSFLAQRIRKSKQSRNYALWIGFNTAVPLILLLPSQSTDTRWVPGFVEYPLAVLLFCMFIFTLLKIYSLYKATLGIMVAPYTFESLVGQFEKKARDELLQPDSD